jgi:NitT/TauT family transport system substrate-binding protein
MVSPLRSIARITTFIVLLTGMTAANAQTPLKLGSSVRSIFSLPLYVADQKGYFKEQGLDPTIIFFDGGPPATAALLGGSVDFISSSLEDQIKVNKQGEDVQSIMTMQSDFSGALVIKKEIADKLGHPVTVADMKGKRIATLARGGYADMAARYLLTKSGVNPVKDATMIPVRGYDKVLAAGEAESVDAALMVEPWQTIAVEGGGKWVYVVEMTRGQGPDVFQDMAYVTLQTNKSTIQKKPETVKKVVGALVKAETYIRDPKNLDDLVKIALVVFPNAQKDDLKRSIQKQQASFRPGLKPEMLTKNMDLLLVNNAITAPGPTVAQAFSTSFVDAAK